MRERAIPPDDISPEEFFTRWLPETVAADEHRRQRLGHTAAALVFELTGNPHGGGTYTVHIEEGGVRGIVGAAESPDLRIEVDVETWRQLNRGEISAPEAALRRRVKLHGNLMLAVKLHLILG
jgi:putative sterol carrier protein